MAWLYAQVDEIIRQRLVEYLETAELSGNISGTNPLLITVLIIAGLLFAWLLSIAGAVIRYGGFSVERKDDDLIVRRGLLERREIAIPLDRIQAIRIVESLPRQLLGYGALYVESGRARRRAGKVDVLASVPAPARLG